MVLKKIYYPVLFLCLLPVLLKCDSVVNFEVFTQRVNEGDSILQVYLTVDPPAQHESWVKIIQEVSSTVDFQGDIIFDNPLIIQCVPGDSILHFEIGLNDDSRIEITEQIMLAIESTGPFLRTGPDGEHVVFVEDNDCVLQFVNLDSVYCIDDEPVILQAFPAGGTWWGESIVDSFLFTAELEPGMTELQYAVHMPGMCEDTISVSLELIHCQTSATETSPDNKFSIYPNPVKEGILWIKVSDHNTMNNRLHIFDLNGNLVGKFRVANSPLRIELNLPAGLYVAKLGTHTQKILIQ